MLSQKTVGRFQYLLTALFTPVMYGTRAPLDAGIYYNLLYQEGIRRELLDFLGNQYSASLGNVERVDVLPFHQMGRFKWKELGLNYKLNDLQPPSHEVVERARAQFRAEGLKAV